MEPSIDIVRLQAGTKAPAASRGITHVGNASTTSKQAINSGVEGISNMKSTSSHKMAHTTGTHPAGPANLSSAVFEMTLPLSA